MLVVVIKINLIREGAFCILTCVSTPERVPFEHVLTQENYNPEAYANAFLCAQVSSCDGARARVKAHSHSIKHFGFSVPFKQQC